jgi:hypothetical protein
MSKRYNIASYRNVIFFILYNTVHKTMGSDPHPTQVFAGHLVIESHLNCDLIHTQFWQISKTCAFRKCRYNQWNNSRTLFVTTFDSLTYVDYMCYTCMYRRVWSYICSCCHLIGTYISPPNDTFPNRQRWRGEVNLCIILRVVIKQNLGAPAKHKLSICSTSTS